MVDHGCNIGNCDAIGVSILRTISSVDDRVTSAFSGGIRERMVEPHAEGHLKRRNQDEYDRDADKRKLEHRASAGLMTAPACHDRSLIFAMRVTVILPASNPGIGIKALV